MRPPPQFKKKNRGLCFATKNPKTKYPTQREAERGLTLIWGSDPHADLKDLHVYQCERCGKYHTGHLSAYQKHLENVAKNAPPPYYE
jgi:hypothetical protein